ncbi:MAG: arylsulfatase, partial [Planctomycetales bacterium]|nr:arylsulfatase [Planctomycetales bacterium]
IVWQPGVVPAGTECRELATTMDLLPTLALLAGGAAPTDRVIDGQDIRSLIRGATDASTPYEAFYYYAEDQLQAVRSGPWKLFVPLRAPLRHPHFTPHGSDRPLLFDVVKDVGCRHDVAADHPDIVARLTNLAAAARRDLGDQGRPGSGQRLPGKLAAATARTLAETRPPDAP